MDLVIKCVTNKYFDFSTRAPRKEFWLFVLFYSLAYLILMGIDISMGTYNSIIGFGILSGIFWMATVVPYLAVGVRRLHDTNRAGWWLLLIFVPIVGAIWLLVLFCFKSDEDENRFGINPLS